MRWGGIELGGTKAIAVLAMGDTIVERVSVPTREPQATLTQMVDRLAAWHTAAPLAGIGVASFGPVRLDPDASDYGHILSTPKPGWSGAAIVPPIAARLDCPIALDTDVNAAALAEYRWGAGVGCSSLTYVTIGTGLGGGTLIEGRSIRGRLHPEIGHLLPRRLPGDAFAGACPFHGDCAEGLLAGPALAARFGMPAEQVAAGDPRWQPVAHDLAQLLAMLLHAYAPQRIVIGGGVGLGAPWLLPMAVARMPAILGGYYPDLDTAALGALIVPALLGGDAGPLGAIALAQTAA